MENLGFLIGNLWIFERNFKVLGLQKVLEGKNQALFNKNLIKTDHKRQERAGKI